MSPPIDIDGSEIQEATIDGTGVSEITIDGQQAADLDVTPDSIIHRYKLDDVSSGSVSDSVGSAPDGTVNGVTTISGNFQGGSAAESTGASADHIDLNSNLPDFESNVESGFAFGFTVDDFSLPSGLTEVFGVSDSAFDDVFRMLIGDSNVGSSSDNIAFRLQESGAKFNGVTEPAGVFDGQKHRVLIGFSVNSLSGAAFIDNSNNGFTVGQDESTFTSPGVDYYLFSSNFGGTTSNTTADGVIDDFIIYNKSPDANLAQIDFDLQPWT